MASSTSPSADMASCSSPSQPSSSSNKISKPGSQSEGIFDASKATPSPKRPLRDGVAAKGNSNIKVGTPPKRLRRESDTTAKEERTVNTVLYNGDDRMESEATPSVSSDAVKECRYTEGLDVLARWSDGLFYLGTVTKVDAEHERCMVSFEDNSEFWVLFKDLQKGHTQNGDITCLVCNDGTSDFPNEIVICDRCGRGYHQGCHSPSIDSSVLKNLDEPWHCRQCVFANSVKVGGALKKGPGAKVFQEVKMTLPYKLDGLHWDTGHKTNTEQCYCYCGGPGDWYLKMLQCCRCRQWFHEACVQCIEIPMMYGDRFYIFVCSVCNQGPEYLKRLPLKWVDLAQLVLYNLTLLYKKKYYDFEEDILPYLTQKWNSYQVPHLAETTRSEKQESMLAALQSSKVRFACGKEVKKKKNLWGLRVRTPPVPPTIVLPAIGQITDEVMNDMKMKGRKVVTFYPVQSLSPVPLERRRKQKGLTAEEIAAKSKKARKLLLQATSTKLPPPLLSPNQTYTGYSRGMSSTSIVTGGCSVLDMIPPLEMVPHGNSVLPCGSTITTHSVATGSAPNGVGASNGPMNQYKRLLSDQSAGKKRRGRKRKNRPNTDTDNDVSSDNRTSSVSAGENAAAPSVQDKSPVRQTLHGHNGPRVNGITDSVTPLAVLQKSVSSYFGAEGRLACGEGYKVLGKRVGTDGKVQYLIQWEGCTP